MKAKKSRGGEKKRTEKKAKWKLVMSFDVETYQCGAKAGDWVRLRKDLVCRYMDGRPTGKVHRAGEVWRVLPGSTEDPGVVFLLQPDGMKHTWDDGDVMWEWFEKVEGE